MILKKKGKALYYHQFSIRITPTENVKITGWLGAVIRNNFLFAAEQVMISERQETLREFINTIPLPQSHPLYGELRNGFPAPYVISLDSHAQCIHPAKFIRKGEVVSFSLFIIGNASLQYLYFLQAIQSMCSRGFGNQMTPFLLMDVFEISDQQDSHLVMVGENILSTVLKYPITIKECDDCNGLQGETLLRLDLTTPLKLYRPAPKTESQFSYQDKMNGFPSFYQFIRSVAYRFFHLTELYTSPDDKESMETKRNELETFIQKATSAILHSADIQHVTLPNTLKKESINRANLSGYVGALHFKGSLSAFMPLLLFMRDLGVGHEVVFGLGRYEVKLKIKNKR